mgnify:CR=1 FL=1
MTIPLVAPVRQTLSQPAITDVADETRKQWNDSSIAQRIKSGDRVGIGVGSRGIANLETITQATIDFVRDLGAKPFIVAAMGSHGGANADGQRELLAEYGISEANLGVEVKTDMNAEQVGVNSWGEPVWWDRNALNADAVLTLSRIKAHTDFRGPFESGIAKMIVIGLGKREGASQHHRWGVRGLRDMMPETAKILIEKTPFLAGLAILENAKEETALLRVVEKENLFEEEPKLLNQAKSIMGRLPFDELDLLVIGEIGKNYSGAGIDPNVIGRLLVENQEEFETPRITRICALDVSPESHGNATGVGLADLTTTRLLDAIDPIPFRMNNLTACFLWRSKLPIDFPNDRECIEMGIQTCWQPDVDKMRMVVIPNTLEVADLFVSAPLLDEVSQSPEMEQCGELITLPFDEKNNLRQAELFPESVQGRRQKERP